MSISDTLFLSFLSLCCPEYYASRSLIARIVCARICWSTLRRRTEIYTLSWRLTESLSGRSGRSRRSGPSLLRYSGRGIRETTTTKWHWIPLGFLPYSIPFSSFFFLPTLVRQQSALEPPSSDIVVDVIDVRRVAAIEPVNRGAKTKTREEPRRWPS